MVDVILKLLQSPFLKQQLATVLLHLLTLAAGGLGMSHVLDQYMSEAQHEMFSLAGVLIAIAVALYNQYRQKQVQVTALQAADMTEHEAKLMVNDPLVTTPSVTSSKDVVPA